MKITNSNQGQVLNEKNKAVEQTTAPRRISAWLASAFLLAFAGGGCTLRGTYPQTTIRGYINGQPFSVQAPKDSNLTGFDAVAETNGAVHVHIDSLQATLNATNLLNAANGQAAIVTATAQAINQAFVAASAAAANAAKAAVAP